MKLNRKRMPSGSKGTVPIVSFVVPSYNYGHYISDCIDSILELQHDYPIEIIVVDDGSEDETTEVVASYKPKGVQLVQNEKNLGQAKTMERGIRRARGEFISRIDPDDRYLPQFLALMVPRLLKNRDVVLAYGNARLINETGHVTLERTVEKHPHDFMGNEFVDLLKSHWIPSPTVLARREPMAAIYPLPAALGASALDDWYVELMMAREGLFCYVDEVVADYRVHDSNLHSTSFIDGSDERFVLQVLQEIYSSEERDPNLEKAKTAAKSRAYANQSLTLANKYFGAGLFSDARRNLMRAIRYRPTLLARPEVIRRLLGTIIGKGPYESLKHRSSAVRPRKHDRSSGP